MVQIVSAASGFPPHYYTQEELLAALKILWSDKRAALGRLERFHRNMTVEGRYLALPLEAYANPAGFGARNNAYIQAALELGERVVCDLLEKTGLAAEEVSLMASTTITGVAVPSLEARLMNRIPFPAHMKRLPLFGLGCLAGAAGVARLADYLRGHPDQAALLLSVELCSLTIQKEDLSVENMVSSGLFGDGAAAVLLVGPMHPLAQPGQPRVVDTRSVFFPNSEHIMGWDVLDSGFKIKLSADVSQVAETMLPPAVEAFLAQHELRIPDIERWVVHPGGPKVIEAVEQGLGLDPEALELSRKSLAAVGNISSTSVLLILEEVLSQPPPPPGSYGMMMAMGPAFSAEMVLLQW